ncbi:hypothetical protein [Sinorhizobium meliloti]|uniref:hypothetical protein n=1 Tax=Rhizobium meliloti TaxID=382 RepID=UPI00299D9021|nr:hypothetical protein [Sinorhizobium meliloti]
MQKLSGLKLSLISGTFVLGQVTTAFSGNGFLEKLVTRPGEVVKDVKQTVIEEATGTDRSNLVQSTQEKFAATRRTLEAARQDTSSQFDKAIAELTSSIAEVESMGIDPHAVRSTDGTLTDLLRQRDELVAIRTEALNKIDDAVRALASQESQAINDINKSYR